MADGVKSTDLTLLSAVDELVGHSTTDGIKRTGRITLTAFTSLLMSGTALGTTLTDLDERLSDLEATVIVAEARQLPDADTATGDVLPSNAYANGTGGVGATLTASVNGAFPTVSGVAPFVGMSIWVTKEADRRKNGLFRLTTLGDGSTKWVLTRRTDTDTGDEISNVSALVGNEDSDFVNHLLGVIVLPEDDALVMGTSDIVVVTLEIRNSDIATTEANLTIGRAVACVDGSAAADGIYTDDTVMPADGYVKRIRIFGKSTVPIGVAGTTKSGDVLTESPDRLPVFVPVALGAQVLEYDNGDFPPIRFYKGERLSTINRNTLAFTGETADGTGFWATTTTAVLRPFSYTDLAVNTTQRLQIGFDVVFGDTPATKAAITEVVSGERAIIGRRSAPAGDTNTITSPGSVFFYAQKMPKPYRLRGVVNLKAASAGNLHIKRGIVNDSGIDFTQVDSDYILAHDTTGDYTEENGLPFLKGKAEEVIGFWSDKIRFKAGNDDNDVGYFASSGGSGNLQSFQDATVLRTNSLMIGFAIEFLDEDEEEIADLAEADSYQPGERIVDASLDIVGLDVVCTATVERDGTKKTYTSSPISISAPAGSNVRYDTLYMDMTDNTFDVEAGTERGSDPTAFIPTLEEPQYRALFNLRTKSSAITFVPLWNIDAGRPRALVQVIDRENERNRSLLYKARGKIRRKSSFRLLGFGDSITAIQYQGINFSDPLNGQYRDRATGAGATPYLGVSYGADVLATIPLYTNVQLGRTNDGAGTVHTRIGWNWELVEALERHGYVLGTDLFYDNGGIGGAASDDAISGTTSQTWLTTALAADADLVVLALGMNELTETFTEDNLFNIVKKFQDDGSDVVIMDVPRPQPYSIFDAWRATNRKIRRVAERRNCAHLAMEPISGDRYIGSLGILPVDVCAANSNNHPGLIEHEVIGRELTRMLLD